MLSRRMLCSSAVLVLGLGCAAPQVETRTEPVAAVAPAPTPPPQAPALRLGTDARPERYQVELTLDPTQATFRGVADIQLALEKPTELLWLHGVGLTVERATFTVGGEEVSAEVLPGSEDVFGLRPARALPAGKAAVHLRYAGKVSDKDSTGVFRQQDGKDWYLYTQFEADFARRAFPSFDEPSFKVPFQLTLKVRAQDAAFSNTPVESEQSGADGWKVVRFKETPPLPTYLVAFAVGPFETVQAAPGGRKQVPVRIIVPRGRTAEAAWAAKATPELVAVLEDYFDAPYPYEKLDTIAIPLTMGWGAMENPGLITFNAQRILAKPEEETESFRRRFAGIQAHELAHQWFGNLVTTAWWNDIWLNEAFASWMGTKTVQAWRPAWENGLQAVQARDWAMGADSLTTARRIRQPIQTKGDIAQAFDAITYVKGSLVLRMFEASLGEETFRKGVQEYMRRHAHGNATADDFAAAVSSAAGRDVSPAFSTFLEQPGLPLVSMGLTCEAGAAPALKLSQKRYLPVGSKGDAAQTWQVPVCVRYGRGKGAAQACTVLTEATGTLALDGVKGCPDWVAPNAGMKGYYRARLEGDLLKRLTRDGGKRLTVAERIGLLGDVGALARSNEVPLAEALALVERVLPSQERGLVTSAVALVESVREDLVPEPLRPHFARYVRKVFGAQARALGLRAKAGESEDARLLRPLLVEQVAGRGEDASLRKEARALAEAWLKDRKAVAPDMVPVVLQVAAAGGDAALRERMMQAAQASSERRERQLLLTALAHVDDAQLAQRNMEAVLGGGLELREAFLYLVRGTTENPSTREVAYRYVKEHFEPLVQGLPQSAGTTVSSAGALLMNVGEDFCDAEHRKDLADFFGERSARHEGAPRALAQALERVDLCIALKEAQARSLAGFLTRY